MVEHELSAADLNESLLLDLVQQTDPAGVLSIYVDGVAAAGGHGTETDVRNRMVELERRLDLDGTSIEPEALREAVRRFAPEIERLVDPRTAGRGRALFIAIDSCRLTWFSTNMRVQTRVVLDQSPFVHPLLELIEAGRPAGVVLVTSGGVEIIDWRLGETRSVARVKAETTNDSRQRTGPVGTNPARGQQSTPTREQQASRQRDRQLRWLHDVAAEVFRSYEDRGWQRLLVCGDDRLTAPLVAALPRCLHDITVTDRRLLSPGDAELALVVADLLAAQARQRTAALGRQIRDAALSSGRGALGLSEVVGALNDARVAHLLYDSGLRHAGAVGADGRLYAAGERMGAVMREPRLTERLVERCLMTSAHVTPVSGEAAGVLADTDGIGALLRW